MPLLALGLNHLSAPLALREQVVFAPELTGIALTELMQVEGVSEAVILSTCNRTELYCRVAPGLEDAPRAWLHRHWGLSSHRLDEFLYRYDEADAVRHAFRVAAGLDSMILGEPQILGQLKSAYQIARAVNALDATLERLFQSAFSVAKRARTETRIGASPVSVAFAAVRLAGQIFADLKQATVLLIGAGETIELAARHLVDTGVYRLLVANRTLAHAQALAEKFSAKAITLSDLGRNLSDADVVITSTASREPILDAKTVKAALKTRKRRPMFMLDLAVPRDIAEEVSALEDVYLYTVDDIGKVIDESLRSRREAALEAEAIIELQVNHFMSWCQALEHQAPLLAFRAAGTAYRDEVLKKAQHMLDSGRSAEEALQYLAHTLTNKLLHVPTCQLRSAAERGDIELLHAAEKIFSGLPEDRRTT